MTNIDNILNRNLPKWPQMRVGGKKLPKEVALEIIRRTDTFITEGYDGNDKEWTNTICDIIRKPKYSYEKGFDYEKYSDELSKFKLKWGVVPTSYVNNSWVNCSFIHGPHGWCHPDGTIRFVDNIGKHPSGNMVYEDWSLICKEFPDTLNLDCVLMSGEDCDEDIKPVIGFRIRNSVIEVVDPLVDNNLLVELGFGTNSDSWSRDMSTSMISIIFNVPARIRESAISEKQLREWAKQVYGE